MWKVNCDIPIFQFSTSSLASDSWFWFQLRSDCDVGHAGELGSKHFFYGRFQAVDFHPFVCIQMKT